MGLFFETLCVRDLRVFADAIDGEVYHFRDKSGLECDAVFHLRNGKYGLVEIKLGGDRLINEGAENLQKLAEKINTDKMNEPSFMMVLVGTGDYAYRRTDGVYVAYRLSERLTNIPALFRFAMRMMAWLLLSIWWIYNFLRRKEGG